MNDDVLLPDDMETLEEAFDIALSVLLRSGDLEEFDEAIQFLAAEIAELIGKGEKRKTLLSSFAIEAYRLKQADLRGCDDCTILRDGT